MFTKLRYNSVTKFFKFVTSPFSYRSSTSTKPQVTKAKELQFLYQKIVSQKYRALFVRYKNTNFSDEIISHQIY